MLRSAKETKGYTIKAADGTIGDVSEYLFDDIYWTVRYLVADVGDWLVHKHVLISPSALLEPTEKEFPVNLTVEQVKKSPRIDAAKPVSRKEEEKLRMHYGWPMYWEPTGMAGPMPAPIPIADIEQERHEREKGEKSENDSHLRSLNEIMGYHIHATDNEIGHIDDIIFDSKSWQFRYLVVDTKNWLPGKKVLISPEWANKISWFEKMLYVNVTKEQIEKSPEYDPSTPVNREYEEILYDFYGRPKYWKQ
ncbi:MAG: PRC-barrel domain containing protein [Chitinivibrionales bacterium]|nr:PRC-barrel domain containing protein [Chitinivibrionales bacterium]